MRKLIFLGLLAGLISAPFLFASGSTEKAATTSKPVVLRAWVRDYSLNYDPPWRSAAAKFEKLHPNVTIRLEGLPYNEQRTKVLIAVGAGKGPDVTMSDCIWLGEFASNNILINVTKMVNASPGLESDYLENFQKSAMWHGKIYGLWTWTDVRMLTWNKDLFRAAGLDPNVPPKTWSDLQVFAKKLTNTSAGVWGYAFPAATTDETADRWYPFLYMNGGQILKDNYTKAAFNSEAGVKALQLLVDLMNKDKASPKDLLGLNAKAVGQGFLANKYAMMIKVGEFWSDYKKNGLTVAQYKHKIGVAPLPVPQGGQPATGSGGWIAGITRDSKHPQLAFDFLKLVVSPKNMVPFLIDNQALPTRKSELKYKAEFAKAIPNFSVAQQVLPTTHFRPPIPQYTKISAQIVEAIQKALSLEATPKQALDQAAQRVNAILAQGS